jgi:hypothetical protein
MHKILISSTVQDRINLYSTYYRKYYSDFYRDGGIWSEDLIIENYISESIRRQDEIYERIMDRLSMDPVFGKMSDNTITIPWRSHYLVISWEDDGDIRKIINLEIK